MAAIGITAFIYRTLLGQFLVKRFVYEVKNVLPVGQGITELTLSPVGQSMSHLSGQFAMLRLSTPLLPNEEHPFTISSAFKNGDLRFSIKGLGDYTNMVSTVTQGTKAIIEGPFGEFHYGYGKEKQVWVAGGVGITPFVSMAEDLLEKDAILHTIDLFYSVRTANDGAYNTLFESVAKKHPSFSYHFMPSDVQGYVTGELITNLFADSKERDFFICGPPPMMTALSSSLISLGIPKKSIHSERFALLK